MNVKILNNNSFWLKLSTVIVIAWLVLVAAVGLVLYFSWGSHHHQDLPLIVEFSTLLFIIPSLALFGLVNSVPLIIEWLCADLEGAADESAEQEVEESGGSYRAMSEQLETEET